MTDKKFYYVFGVVLNKTDDGRYITSEGINFVNAFNEKMVNSNVVIKEPDNGENVAELYVKLDDGEKNMIPIFIEGIKKTDIILNHSYDFSSYDNKIGFPTFYANASVDPRIVASIIRSLSEEEIAAYAEAVKNFINFVDSYASTLESEKVVEETITEDDIKRNEAINYIEEFRRVRKSKNGTTI